jgi:hypothetical protein
MLQHFDGMERNFESTGFEHVSKWMLEHGYGFDFFSDRQLQRFRNVGSSIQTGGNNYQVILLPANKLITTESFGKLLQLAKNGATVLVYKNLPSDVPGWNELDKRRKAFQSLIAQLSFSETGGIKKASYGKGEFIISDDLDALMDAAKVKKESFSEHGLSFIRRKNTDGAVYFINNRSEKPIYDWVQLNTKASGTFFFDPMSGAIRAAKHRINPSGIMEVLVQLQPYESVIVQTYKTARSGVAYNYVRPGIM